MASLVTGSSGMLGRALSAHLSRSGPVLGLSRSGKDGSLQGDLSDEEGLTRLFDRHPVDFVFNCAAYSDVDGCERDPAAAHQAKVLGPRHLSRLCGRRGIPWIHVSTDYVFDGSKRTPYTEEDAAAPVNIYGLTKWAGEFYAVRSASPCADAGDGETMNVGDWLARSISTPT